MRLRSLALATIAVAALGLAQAPTHANAAEQARKPIHRTEKAKAKARAKAVAPIHCVRDLSRAGAPTTCYNTFTKAIAAATGGRIANAPANARVAMLDRRLTAKLNALPGAKPRLVRRAAGAAPITILFQRREFQGSTLTFTGDRACTRSLGDVDYRRDNVDFTFGSYWAYRGCRARLFEKPGRTGASTGYHGSMRDVFGLRWTPRSMHWS